MGYYFAGPDGKHEHADTVHVEQDCSHVQKSSGRVYPISYVPDDASICGTCGPLESEPDSGGDDDDRDDVQDAELPVDAADDADDADVDED